MTRLIVEVLVGGGPPGIPISNRRTFEPDERYRGIAVPSGDGLLDLGPERFHEILIRVGRHIKRRDLALLIRQAYEALVHPEGVIVVHCDSPEGVTPFDMLQLLQIAGFSIKDGVGVWVTRLDSPAQYKAGLGRYGLAERSGPAIGAGLYELQLGSPGEITPPRRLRWQDLPWKWLGFPGYKSED